MMTAKEEMIKYHLKGRDIHDPRVLRAMKEVDRTKFVPDELIPRAYDDGPLPIGKKQTISQPYIVAYMTQAVQLKSTDTVLEIGAGCGYNAAVLSRVAKEVFSVEIIEWLASLAKDNLKKADIDNVEVKHDDGYEGWPEKGPFDAIVITAAAPKLPEKLKEQLKIGGRLLAPVGTQVQELKLWKKISDDEYEKHTLLPVRFVPMTGEIQNQ